MRKRFIILTLTLATAMGAFSGYYVKYHLPGSGISSQSDLIDSRRADFVLHDYDNNRVPVSTWDGKVIMLNFWASWCPPCRREIPGFSQVRELYHEDGFEVIGIAIDDKEKAEKFLQTMPDVKYPQLVGYNDAIAVAKLFGNKHGGLPYSVIIDSDGIIRFIKAGELLKDELIDQIDPLL